MSREVLDAFGQRLIKEVRDEAITRCKPMIEQLLEDWKKEGCHVTPGEETALEKTVTLVIDDLLSLFLYAFDEGLEGTYLRDEFNRDLPRMSDGISIELFSFEDTPGWIERFSIYGDEE